MSFNTTPVPARREDIEAAVGVLIEYLNSDNNTCSIVVRLHGAITDKQVEGIEQGILLVTRQQVQLAHHYYAEPEEGEAEGGYTLLGTVELT